MRCKIFKTIITNVKNLKMNLIPARTIEGIKLDEGLSLVMYKCTADKWTIGYGQNIEDDGISEAAADFLLTERVKVAQRELRDNFDWFIDLNAARQYVLINVHFNMGITRLWGFKKMIAALCVDDYETAAIELLDSNAARELINRYDRLAKIMREGKH